MHRVWTHTPTNGSTLWYNHLIIILYNAEDLHKSSLRGLGMRLRNLLKVEIRVILSTPNRYTYSMCGKMLQLCGVWCYISLCASHETGQSGETGTNGL